MHIMIHSCSQVLVTMSQLPLLSDFLACERSMSWLDKERLKTIKLPICYLFCMGAFSKARL
jgi:hypothetical protein